MPHESNPHASQSSPHCCWVWILFLTVPWPCTPWWSGWPLRQRAVRYVRSTAWTISSVGFCEQLSIRNRRLGFRLKQPTPIWIAVCLSIGMPAYQLVKPQGTRRTAQPRTTARSAALRLRGNRKIPNWGRLFAPLVLRGQRCIMHASLEHAVSTWALKIPTQSSRTYAVTAGQLSSSLSLPRQVENF